MPGRQVPAHGRFDQAVAFSWVKSSTTSDFWSSLSVARNAFAAFTRPGTPFTPRVGSCGAAFVAGFGAGVVAALAVAMPAPRTASAVAASAMPRQRRVPRTFSSVTEILLIDCWGWVTRLLTTWSTTHNPEC